MMAPPANAVSLVSRDELQERQPARLTETLEDVPGVWKTDESSSAVPTIRGLARGHVVLLLDDGRVTAERRVGASASYLNPFSLENVEVVRGPGSVAYGSDAFGGAVHAKTPLPVLNLFSARYQLTAGAGGTPEYSGGLSVNVPAGGTAFTIQAQQRYQPDYESPAGEQTNSASRDRGFLIRWLVPVGKARLFAAAQVDQVRDMGKPAADTPTTRTVYPREDSSRFTLGLDVTDVAGFSSVEVRGFFGSYRLVTNRERLPNATTTRRIPSSDVDADDASFRILARRPLGPVSLRVGVDVNARLNLRAIGETQSFDAQDRPTTLEREVSIADASRTDWGAFVEADVPLIARRLELAAGLRGDLVRSVSTGGYFGDRSLSKGALSGFATLSVHLAPEWTAALQYSRGFRDPTLSDRYFRGVSGRGFVVGNPDLGSETSNQYDLSLRGRVGPVSLAAYGFLYRIEDLVERFRNGNDFNFRNRGEEEIRGAELEASFRLAPGLVTRVSGTVVTGEILDDGSDAADIPPRSFSLTVDHAVTGSLWWRGRFLAVARDDRPGPTEVAVPGYGRLDLSAGWRFSELLGLAVSVRNVLDKSYPDSSDELFVTAPGRGALVTLQGSF
jgi:outer membrane receptor protein involved in Fe transport